MSDTAESLPTWERVLATAWDADDPQTILALVALAAELRSGGRGPVAEVATAPEPEREPLTLRWDANDLVDDGGVSRGWLDARWGWVAHGVTSADDDTGPGPMPDSDARAALVDYWTRRGYRLVTA